MNNRIKHIIKEEIDRVMTEKKFKDDFEYLSPFNYMGKYIKGGKDQWIFALSYKKNDLIVKIIKNGDAWSFGIESDGKQSEHDAKIMWGPYNSYEEMKKEVCDKLHNNLQLSTGNLKNDRKDAENDDLLQRIDQLFKKGKVLMSLKDGNLEDVKDLYRLANSLRGLDREGFIDGIRDEYESIRGISNVLNKIQQIDYYKKLEKYQGY